MTSRQGHQDKRHIALLSPRMRRALTRAMATSTPPADLRPRLTFITGNKKKLSEVQHEYDMILSENYALKAHLKKGRPAEATEAASGEDLSMHDTKTYRTEDIARQLEDTKSLRQEDIDGVR